MDQTAGTVYSEQFYNHNSVVVFMELGTKEDAPVNPEQAKISLCSEHGYELKHYCEDCDKVVCIYCIMKEHNDHNHNMLKKWHRKRELNNTITGDEDNVQINVISDQVKKKRKTRSSTHSDSCKYMYGQMVGKVMTYYGDGEHVMSCVPRLPDCTVSNPVVVSDQVKLTAILKDVCGSPITNQSSYLEISCNKEKEFMQNIHIEEQSRGQYIISYNPKRKECHSLSVSWKEFHAKSKVLVNLRHYTDIKQEVKIIGTYQNNNLKRPYLLAKGSNNELIVRSSKELVVFDKHLQYSHVIGRTGSHCTNIFQAITGLAVDKKGYLYVADCDLHRILKFALNGMPISIIGSEGTANGQFRSPYGLLLTQSQLLFVCDFSNHRIQVFKNDQFLYCFGEQGTEPGNFHYPIDLTMNNSEDKLFVSDCNCRVQVFSAQGQFLKVFDCDFTNVPYQLQHPVGIHYTPDGHLLISCYGTHCVMVFKEDGKFVSAIEGTYQGKERFSHPCGVVMMDYGQIVIAGSYNKLVVF